jgi:DNA replication protein DnaC
LNVEREEALRREHEAVEKEKRDISQKRLFSEIQIGQRYRGQAWDDYKPATDTARKTLETCRQFATGFKEALETGRCLIMIGGPGTGKNMLSALICQDVAGQGFTALHTTAMKLVRRVKETWGKGSEESESQAIRNFTLPDLLVIDEIGVQFGSTAEQIILTEIINDRYEAMRPTIIISNLTVPQLEDVMGKRVVDRFYEGGGKVLVFNWASWRRRAA